MLECDRCGMTLPKQVTMSLRQAQRRSVAAMALAARLKLVDTDEGEFDRASGDSECDGCGLRYDQHPHHPRFDWLTVLCSGRLVKL